MRTALLLSLAAAVALGQGTDPKPKADDYDVHAATSKGALGAEFMVHSFSGRGQTYVAKDYLVVEVALYPPKGQGIQVRPGEFSLRVNGRKTLLTPVSPSEVVSSLQHADWSLNRGVELGGTLGNTGVILGRPAPSRIPGEPSGRAPQPPRAPDSGSPGGIDPEPRVTAAELVVETALPEDPRRGPIAGFLYFPYKGKPSGIKSLELLFEDAALKLR